MKNKNQYDDFNICKSSGTIEKFYPEKLYLSLLRSGLTKQQANSITEQISRQIKSGCKTKEIYQKSLKLVKQTSHVAAIHYSLKKALFALGPEGHNFELFVAKYFETLGYSTKTKQFIQGKFVKHEVDVVAIKNGHQILVECKFHNHVGAKNNIQVVLYVKARWDDIKAGPNGNNFDSFYLASNTAFSSDALIYAKGVNLHVLGINSPIDCPFIEEIKQLRLYPITSLNSINSFTKKFLIEHRVILAKEIPNNIHLLKELGINEKIITKILEEVNFLINCHR